MRRSASALALALTLTVITASRADATTHSWHLQTVPNAAGATSGNLNGVACPTSTVCTAVGASNLGTLAERWNGTAWSVQTTPNPAAPGQFASVACPTTTFCMAVGSYFSSSHHAFAEKWNGTSWSLVTVPHPTGSSGTFLDGVVCSSATACMAVGASVSSGAVLAMAQHWNGTKWKLLTVARPPTANASAFAGVSCPATTDCTAVGSYTDSSTMNDLSLSEHWNGTTWSQQTTPNPADSGGQVSMQSVACHTSAACQAAGWYETTAGAVVPLAMRWNGSSWSLEFPTTPIGGAELAGVACASTTVCTVVGYGPTNGSSVMEPLAERWTSTGGWAVQATPAPAGSMGVKLNAVRCVTTTLCEAVGFAYNSSNAAQPLAERYF